VAGLPTDRLAGGELQLLSIFAEPADAPTTSRTLMLYQHALTDRTATLGAALAAPAVTGLGGASPVRIRATLPVQPDYARLARAEFRQADRRVIVAMSAGFAGAGGSWDLTVPDLSGAGFDPSWGLHAGAVEWTIDASGGTFVPELGGTPQDGSILRFATRAGSVGTPSSALRRTRVATGSTSALDRVERARRASVRRLTR
jgi:hypothetical protein